MRCYRHGVNSSGEVALKNVDQALPDILVLARTGWNRPRAAQMLRLSCETLSYRIEKHNLKAPNPLSDC